MLSFVFKPFVRRQTTDICGFLTSQGVLGVLLTMGGTCVKNEYTLFCPLALQETATGRVCRSNGFSNLETLGKHIRQHLFDGKQCRLASTLVLAWYCACCSCRHVLTRHGYTLRTGFETVERLMNAAKQKMSELRYKTSTCHELGVFKSFDWSRIAA